MNRRGFLSAIVGAGAVAAVPLSPVVALGRPVPDSVPPPVAPPASPVVSPFDVFVDELLADVRAAIGIRPEVAAHLFSSHRLGTAVSIREPRPFRPFDSGPLLGPVKLALLNRQIARGVEYPTHPGLDAIVPDKRARLVDELAAPIAHEHKLGSRGLVFGLLPHIPDYGIYDCHVAKTEDGCALRGLAAYMLLYDQFVFRADVLYGWLDAHAVAKQGLGRTLLMV